MNDDEEKELIPTTKIGKDDLKHLILKGVKLTYSCVLGQGSFATVYKAEHNGAVCAAKQLDLSVKVCLAERVEQNFLLECLQHSKLSHPNIVTMLGVFYPSKQTSLPVLVMELMEYNLTQLLERSHNILMYVKLSILQDVSRGLCYLHAQNPPIVHQALYSDNILFTTGLTAKVADFKTGAGTVSDQALLDVRRNRDSIDFLPDSHDILMEYEWSLNVFSFGCIVCHVITQKLPSVEPQSNTRRQRLNRFSAPTLQSMRMYTFAMRRKIHHTIDDWSVKERQDYIDLISENSLKQLVEACLQCNSTNRPHMSQVYKIIASIMTGELCSYFKKCAYH